MSPASATAAKATTPPLRETSALRITLERSALLRALSHVQSVVERRNTIPILANVLLRAEPGTLSLCATDMDLEIIETVAADCSTKGAFTAPAHTLYDIVRKLPDGAMVELATGAAPGQMMLSCGRSNFRLGCLPVDDFPQMSGGELPHQFTLGASELRSLIDRTKFAISTEETRYYLNGIYLHATAPGSKKETAMLRAVATDGHRLARMEMPAPEGSVGMPGVIVPRKAVGEVRKLLDEITERAEIALSANKIRIRLGNVMLTSKLIDGTFPDYERVIPTANDKLLEVRCKDFAAAVDRVATIATEKTRAVKLSLANGQITITAQSNEAGSAAEELEATYTAPAIEIGFNARYLLDVTGQIEGDTLRLSLADGGSPTLAQDVADASALYVLMPMRV